MSKNKVREFNNEVYRALVDDLINDAFYTPGISKRGVVAKIRQCAEVVLRRILNIEPKKSLTLGSKTTKSKVKEKNCTFLETSVHNINKMGSKCTHTQYKNEITETDVKEAIDNLFNLYAYLLIEYFEKYEFGSNLQIIHHFSLLPPIIRYLTLEYLHTKYPENTIIIDKLSLAILKAFDEDQALCWIEERKEKLQTMSSVSENAEKDIVDKSGEDVGRLIIELAPNMYDNCVENVKLLAKNISENGKLYLDFESAIEYYQSIGPVQGDSDEIKEFNSIMEFLYLGRKSIKDLKE